MAAPQASSRLEMLQARFQQKQLQEKEQKLLQLYDQQQQRAYQVVQRGSAGSSNGSNHGSMIRTTTTSHTTSTSQGGKVRQMFDERRQTTVKGIDRSYPLEPLENKLRKQATNGLTTQRNGNLTTTVNRQSVNVRRVARADVNSNVNGGKPVVSYREQVTRESFGPSVHRHDDEDEFGSENRVVNGHRRHDLDNEEEALDQETIERNRMMAKIHLMGFDESLKHRVGNDLESEEFPEYLMVDVPRDKASKRSVTKKLSQAEARLEQFKNANARRSNNNAPKQPAAAKRRTEQMPPARSNSRIAKSPSPDASARKQHETNAARATRGSAPSSPSKSPDRHVAPRRGSTEPRNQQDARLARRSVVAKAAESIGSKTTTETMDAADGVVQQDDSPHESSAKKSDAFVIDLDDRPKESDTTPPKKVTPMRRSSNDKNQTTSSASGRPGSSVSSNFSSAGTTQGQASGTKSRMATRAKTPVSGGSQARGPSSARNTNSADNLVACHTCGRSFVQDRISLHEKICAKTMNKKRKQFDAMTFRVRGTELEPFVKKGVAKKRESHAKKPELKSNWRRKHEEFIEAIRSAKMVQSHLAAGGSLKDLPPPPPSDTSDYIQCPHCGRRFNQAAAERHIPKCQHMLHNKPTHARAARPRR